MTAAVPPIAIAFAALGVVFIGLSLRDFLRAEGKLTPARKAWLRLALIFAAIAIGLVVWHSLFT